MFRGKRIISGIMLVLMLVSFIGCKKTSKAATFTYEENAAGNIVITGLTDKEYEFIENIRKENAERLSKMSKEELLEYIKTLCPEQELNFEKQIKGTTYKVNTYFNENSEYTILQILFEILRK
jgi:hypothetical protein